MSELVTQRQSGLQKKYRFTEAKRNAISGYLYIAPFFILFAIFDIFPMFFSFYLGFQKWNGLGEMKFYGLRNFELIFTDPIFWESIWNTFIIGIISTVPQLIMAIILAFVLNSRLLRFKNFFRVSYFLPYITSVVAVTLIFKIIFSNHETGLVNILLNYLGFKSISWTTSYWGIKVAITIMIIWRWVGFNTIIYLAGLQSIPNELYEAATIDGASQVQQLRHISIPLLRPAITFTVFTSTIGSLQLFTEPLIFLTKNSIRQEGITMVLYLYRDAFERSNFGKASATSIVLFLIIVIVASLNYYLSNTIGTRKRRD
ncbi:MAG TPA: sugar ABC transporter permease [Clostridiaceae bacterium]|nr:sugar ABC transporter permease [Clostridiaceae bacterium]